MNDDSSDNQWIRQKMEIPYFALFVTMSHTISANTFKKLFQIFEIFWHYDVICKDIGNSRRIVIDGAKFGFQSGQILI